MNLTQIQSVVSLILMIGPALQPLIASVYSTVRAVEAAFPDSSGKQKFDAAMNQLGAVWGALTTEASPLLTGMINAAVATMNAIGEFKKSSTGTTATPAPVPATPATPSAPPATSGFGPPPPAAPGQ